MDITSPLDVAAFAARSGGMIVVQSIAALVPSGCGQLYSSSTAAATMMATEDVPKARPRQTAERAIQGWAAGEPNVYSDRFARLIHERLASDADAVATSRAATRPSRARALPIVVSATTDPTTCTSVMTAATPVRE